MPLGADCNAFPANLKFKQCDDGFIHKLGADRTADQGGKFFCRQGKVLLDLDNREFVFPAFGLDRNDVVGAKTINANVNFVGLHLTHIGDSCAQMVLQRVAGDACKNVNQPVVSELCEKGLFV